MGAAMAANVARAGFETRAWNRTPGRAPELDEIGIQREPTPAELATASDIVVSIVSDTPDVDAVLFGPDGVASGAAPGTLVVDMSTISPSATRDFAARLAEMGIAMLDAPVSGGSEGAQKGTLTIFVGGDAADLERARPVLEAMGRTITHVGAHGAGQAVKAVNQVLANRSGRMLANDYPLGFKVALHRKDLNIALAMARELGADLPVSALAETLEAELMGAGHADDDMSALARSIRGRSGLPD
jgi:3-hydroxyisobutyrate dehydrogenase